jgi:transposase-like protein
MGNHRGLRRDYEALEKRRMRVMVLWEQGKTRGAVARRVGVVVQIMARWVSKFGSPSISVGWRRFSSQFQVSRRSELLL